MTITDPVPWQDELAALPPTPDNLTRTGRMLADLDRATRAQAAHLDGQPDCECWLHEDYRREPTPSPRVEPAPVDYAERLRIEESRLDQRRATLARAEARMTRWESTGREADRGAVTLRDDVLRRELKKMDRDLQAYTRDATRLARARAKVEITERKIERLRGLV